MARSGLRRQQRIADKLDQGANHDHDNPALAQAKVQLLSRDPWTTLQQHQVLHLRRLPVQWVTRQPRKSDRGNGCESTPDASFVGALDIGSETRSARTSVQGEAGKCVRDARTPRLPSTAFTALQQFGHLAMATSVVDTGCTQTKAGKQPSWKPY